MVHGGSRGPWGGHGALTGGDSPDLVAGLHSDPLRDGPVLLLLLSEEALDPEGLVGRLEATRTNPPTLTQRAHGS